MAPHRLKSRLDLRKEAAGFTPPTFRFWLIARTPTVLIDNLLEVLAAIVGLILGPAFMTGFVATPVSNQISVPVTMALSWVLIIGGVVVFIGLLIMKYGTTVPAGMFMLAGGFLCYGVAVMAYAELRVGLVTLVLLVGLAALTAWKGFLLRSTFLLVSARPVPTDHKG